MDGTDNTKSRDIITNSMEYYILVKFTLLSTISTISTLFLVILSLTIAATFGTDKFNQQNALTIIVLVNISYIDSVINCVCVMLQFAFYDKLYERVCSPCHVCCQTECCKPNSVLKQNYTIWIDI